MYKKALNFLRGSVALHCACSAPERVINLCALRNIPFWDLCHIDEEHFTLRTTRGGAELLRCAVEQSGLTAQLTVQNEAGAPVRLRGFRRRYVLLAALGVAAACIWSLSSFVWAFTVTGNDTVPTEAILRCLEKNGVAVGTPVRRIHQETLRNHVLLELTDLSWLSVNVRGCTAHIQVVERRRPPQIFSSAQRANVVASRDGLVIGVEALQGRGEVAVGDTVTAGQLLISGVSDSRFGGMRLMNAQGRIYARTWYELSLTAPLEVAQKGETARTVRRFALIAGKHRINFYTGGSILGTGCDKITAYHSLSLPFGITLPLHLAVETVTQSPLTATTRTVQQAQQEAEAQLLALFAAARTADAEVTETAFLARRRGGSLQVTLRAECVEDIALRLPQAQE